MRRKIYFAVATLLVASVTRADDHFSNAGQTRPATAKPVASATAKPVASASQQPKQIQPVATSEELSTRAIDERNVKLVQSSRAIPGQQSAVISPAPVQLQSFFGRIMELERRKNAWLRRTFLGRE